MPLTLLMTGYLGGTDGQALVDASLLDLLDCMVGAAIEYAEPLEALTEETTADSTSSCLRGINPACNASSTPGRPRRDWS